MVSKIIDILILFVTAVAILVPAVLLVWELKQSPLWAWRSSPCGYFKESK